MAKSKGQKLKLLHILKILKEESDENHTLTVNYIISRLAAVGILAERKSIYEDMEDLSNFGYDIICEKKRSNEYFLGEREFEAAEIKLLADAIQSAKFISESKSRRLIKKLGELLPKHEAVFLNRQLYMQGRTKSGNEKIYYNVDALHNAINSNKSIKCYYYEWHINEKTRKKYSKKARHGGRPYYLSPWALLWDNENYYLLAYDKCIKQMRHYRVDKIEEITLLEEKRRGEKEFEKIDLAQYTKQIFGMFGGKEESVTIKFNNRLIGVVIDRFGKDLLIQPLEDGCFEISPKIVVSPQFYAWIFGFGTDAKIISPANIVADMKKYTHNVLELY